MNRVITINLNGNAYQLEESGYDALRTYLDNAARRLEGNPDKDEIVADIEQAIADKFGTLLRANKTVVTAKEVDGVIMEMGPVEDSASNGTSSDASGSRAERTSKETAGGEESKAGAETGVPRRLYRIYPEGAMICGVCNGLAAYFNIDVTIVRLLFVILCFVWGTGVWLYVLMVVIVPSAKTPAEKSAATGVAATAQEFIRRAKAGYYEGMKTFQDKHAHREWKRKFKQDMRGWKQGLQHEIRRNAHQWQHWSHPSAHGYGPSHGLAWLIDAVLMVAGIYAIFLLVTTGAVFGLALPAGVPLWVGVVGVIVIWKSLAWPLRAMQYWHGGYGRPCTGPFGAFGDFLIGVGFMVLIVWLLDRYVPQFHEMLKHLPPFLHRALDSAQQWLDKH